MKKSEIELEIEQIQQNVKTLFPNAILVNKPNSNYPSIIASNYSEKKDEIDFYLSTHMQHSKTELEAWQNAKIWIDNTLGNPNLNKSTLILDLNENQRDFHLNKLNDMKALNVEYYNSLTEKLATDANNPETKKLKKELKKEIKLIDVAIINTIAIIEKSNMGIGNGQLTLNDLETLPAAILLHVDSELYTFDPKKKMNNLSDEEFNKLLKLKETKNDIVLIKFRTDDVAMTQSITTGDLKPVYLNDLKLLSDKQTGMYLFKKSIAVKPHPTMINNLETNRFSQWLNEDSDNDGLTNAEELYRGTNPYNSDTDGDGIIDGVEIAQNTNPLEAKIKDIPTVFDEITSKAKELPQGTKYRIVPIKEISTQDILYHIQEKHKVWGWRDKKVSEKFPEMKFEDKNEALNIFNKMQTLDINKSKGLKI